MTFMNTCRHVLPKSALNVKFELTLDVGSEVEIGAIFTVKFSWFGELSPGSFTKVSM